MSLPDLPQAPGQDATWDEHMRYFEAQLRLAEYEQRAMLNTAAETRNTALVEAHRALATVQGEAKAVAEQQLEVGRRMVELMEETPPGSPPDSNTDGTSERARVVVTAMLAETDKPPAEVVSAVQARIGAADAMLTTGQ
jgi:hypothetical protein